jgi:uncharacterized membrane protein
MTEVPIQMRRNKNKGWYRLLLLVFAICLVIYTWLWVAQMLDHLGGWGIMFGFVLWIAACIGLIWLMRTEPDYEAEYPVDEQPKAESG